MSLKLVHRPARITAPSSPPERRELSPPPRMADPQRGMPLQTLLPVVGAMSSVVMITVLRTNPIMIVVGALIFVVAIVSGVGMAVSQRGQQQRRRRVQRERYLDYLEEVRADLRAEAERARQAALEVDPDPSVLLELVRDPERRWERRRANADFLRLRIGTGTLDWFGLEMPVDDNPVEPFDELMETELRHVRTHYSVVHGMPTTIDLDSVGDVSIVGDPADTARVVRSILAQAAALHAPDDLVIAAVVPPERAADWDGIDRLPHVVMDAAPDARSGRRIAPDMRALADVLRDELRERATIAASAKRSGGRPVAELPRLLVFADDSGHIASVLPSPDRDLTLRELRITVVHVLTDRLHEPSHVSVRITAAAGAASVMDVRRKDRHGIAVDDTSTLHLEALSRELAPLRLQFSSDGGGSDMVQKIGITELLGIDDVSELEDGVGWSGRTERDFLRVPIGVDDEGRPLLLDLKESAQLGMGPHGICIGATGSGKSEMLRTLVLGLAISHAPEDLSMVLVDYKGGAAFAPFSGLPHVAGIIDNLAEDPQLTRRAQTSIAGEVRRRQEVLRAADSSPSITHYRQLRRSRPSLEPLPHLLLVIDEFGELLTAEPEFVDLLLMIGRIGRSIGVHLLLSSQRIEQGRLRGLDTYLSYRLGLRTFSEGESQVVLDTKDAFHLPAVPGYGYLKVDTSIYERFRAGYVSGPVPSGLPDAVEEVRPQPLLLPAYPGGESDDASDDDASSEASETASSASFAERTLLDESVDRLRRAARPTSPVWLPPLPTRLALGRVLGGDGHEPMHVPIGLLDDPARQRQEPWVIDLTRGGGHVAVFGAPQTGRSTFLRTVAVGLALSHTPSQVSIYGLDLSGGGLARIESFPHVGGVATRSDRERMGRLLEELLSMVRQREQIFRDRHVDSLPMLRSMHARGEVPEIVSPDIVLLVDGFSSMRADFEDLEPAFADLLLRGGSFGLHVVIATNRWNDVRMQQQPLFGQRVELRLNDPSESVVGRRIAETLSADEPGRVVTDDKLFAHIALPVLDDTDDDAIGEQVEQLARRSAASWSGASAAPIRLLPEDLDPNELPDALDEPDYIPFGLRQDTMQPAYFDASRDQHMLVFGDAGSGKSTFLRGIAAGFMDRYTSEEVVIGVMDVRGATAAAVPEDYLGGHASNVTQATALATSIAKELERRSDPAEAASKPGARIVLLVDDHDILSSGGRDPLAPLVPYLPSARDLRVHVFLTRPVAGSGRAMFEIGIQVVRDTGGTGLVMSGERSEGQVFPRVYAEQMVPGRGRLVRRGEPPRLVQVARFPIPAASNEEEASNAS
jgi:S-DNA-T family DNA segregation ATPase FtsK/SpoIIIE